MKVFAFRDNTPCSWYRIKLPFLELHKAGHQVDAVVGWDERCRQYDVIVGQRWNVPSAMPDWYALARSGHRLVYEIDDDLWSLDEWNTVARAHHPPMVLEAAKAAIRAADAVHVTTEPLAEAVRAWNPNVTVLPNHVPGELFEMQRPRRERVVVGWAGSDSHLGDLALIGSQLARFVRRNPTAEFHNMGSDYRRVLGISGRHTPGQGILEFYRAIDFDIGLAPVARTRFNRSKSGIKALEYMALGIPVIASDYDPYRPVVRHGVTGFLVRQEHEWGKRMYELLKDDAMREEMGRNAREHARRWSIATGWRLWESAYGELAALTVSASR